MTKKRKSVSFREQVSNIYPKSFDGSSSPAAINTAPATAYQSPKLDPKYVTWLRSATKAHYPFIANGTFANHLYLQNFDLHEDMRHPACFQRAEAREAAVPALAEKYGSLGWGSLYAEVTEEAWVKNYREIYRFDGSDERLLEKIAEVYDEIKRFIAIEEEANAHLSQVSSIYSTSSDRQWEAFTQGIGPLVSPDFGPGGMHLAFEDAADVSVDSEEPVRIKPRARKGYGDDMLSDVRVVRRDFANAMMDAGGEVPVFGTRLGQSRLRYETR